MVRLRVFRLNLALTALLCNASSAVAEAVAPIGAHVEAASAFHRACLFSWRALLGVLVACAVALSSERAGAILIERPTLPDATTVADSARGVVIATCTRGSTYEVPAIFNVDALLGGAVPATFTAYPLSRGYRGDIPFRAGHRYALLLRTAPAPIGPEYRRVSHCQAAASSEARHSDKVGPTVGRAFTDSAAADLYSAVWRLSSLGREQQAAQVAAWARSPGPPYDWAIELILRHPDLGAAEPIRAFLLERLRVGWDLNREWAAGQLALHPDSTTRKVFLSLAHGDSDGPKLAVLLGSRDRSPWVRQTILSIADQTLAGAPGPAPDMLRLNEPDVDRWVITLSRLRAIAEALQPDRSEAERLMLIRIAQWARPRHWLRYAALRPLAHDTTWVVRRLIWQTVEGDPAARSVWVENAPEPGDVTPCWTTEELHRALCDSSSIVRLFACAEVGRRRDLVGADSILAWLRQNRVPGRVDIPLREAEAMIKALGESRSPAAFADLLGWGEIGEDRIRQAVMDALEALGDPRAAPYFRRLAKVPCSRMENFQKRSLASGLSVVGDASDVALFVGWAKDCPNVRDVALEAVGVLGGVPRMVQVIRQVEAGPMKPEQSRDYELLEARVRDRIRHRGQDGIRRGGGK